MAGLIGKVGLLTREGLDLFYPIFKDMEHWMDDDYEDPFPSLPFSEKPKGAGASEEYKARLERVCLHPSHRQPRKSCELETNTLHHVAGLH